MRMKGQWFIISAVFVAFSMLAISSDLRSFSVLDTASVAGFAEEYHYYNVRAGLKKTITFSENTCPALSANLREFAYAAQQTKARLGYYVNVTYQILDCPTKNVFFNLIMLKSDKLTVWEANLTI